MDRLAIPSLIPCFGTEEPLVRISPDHLPTAEMHRGCVSDEHPLGRHSLKGLTPVPTAITDCGMGAGSDLEAAFPPAARGCIWQRSLRNTHDYCIPIEK